MDICHNVSVRNVPDLRQLSRFHTGSLKTGSHSAVKI